MKFLNFVTNQKVIVFDGAMGTQLDRSGLMGRGEVNLSHPQVVLEIHRAYLEAGAQVLTTNTLTMNRIFLETHNVDVRVREVNRAGAVLAREAAGEKGFVLGDLSSTGQMLEPYGAYKKQQFIDAFTEQAEVLAEFGVNGFIIETIFDLNEAVCAVKACRDHFPLPVCVAIAFQTEEKNGRTIMGQTAGQCARALVDEGADVIGANCGQIDPARMAKVMALMKAETGNTPLLAQPNAGKPELADGKTLFRMTPDLFAEGATLCIEAGACCIGGCCGTSPQHIQALVTLLKQKGAC
jgi:5-methyltetrahydrofolate--homocysteine methyltransferase